MNLTRLIRRLIAQIGELLREDAALAKVELERKCRRLATGVALFAGAAVIGVALLAVLVAAAILGLDTVFVPWLSALIVAAGMAAAIAICSFIGLAEIRAALPLVPMDAITSFKENIVWAKTLTTSRGRS